MEWSARDIRNRSLGTLDPLVGAWLTTVSNAAFLDAGATLDGETEISWLDGGALLLIRSRIPGGPPSATQAIGRNEEREDFTVLYADDRGVSRVYAMAFDGLHWTMHREDSGFHQRFEGRLSPEGDRIDAAWYARDDESQTWRHDFDIAYRRA